MYKINEVSKLTGVSIRMLHHYDKIRLLEPSKRTDSNYRMYNDDDIARLYQILLFKELEFPLQEIKQILDYHWNTILSVYPPSFVTSNSVGSPLWLKVQLNLLI